MQRNISIRSKENKRQLVEQVASSHYLAKSIRLREMFVYVCDQVLEHSAAEIHEQEVGSRVFGRPEGYDTSADNTVRVHASMLRKRIEQYFATEGSSEPIIIEIPRGNYAPVFRERPVKPALPEPTPISEATAAPVAPPPVEAEPKWKFWLPTALAAVFAAISLLLFLNARSSRPIPVLLKGQPTVGMFWSQIFVPGKSTDLVIGDATLGTFQEMTDHPIALSEYFDRSYLGKVEERATAAKVDPSFAQALILKRQSSYGEISLLARLTDASHALQSDTKVRFARDYSFRELKADNVVLLGYRTSDPWIEPFENYLALRWKYDPSNGSYYPMDTAATDQEKFRITAPRDQPHDGYATISLVPNMSNSGNVLILAGSGGAAIGATLDFLSDEHSITQLHSQLSQDKKAPFPYFEALLRIGNHNTLPRDSSIVLCRQLRPQKK